MATIAKVFKAGNIKCTIFENESSNGVFYTTSVSRSYQKNNKWEYTDGMTSKDIPTASALFMKAFDWILEKESLPAEATKKTSKAKGSGKKQSSLPLEEPPF